MRILYTFSAGTYGISLLDIKAGRPWRNLLDETFCEKNSVSSIKLMKM